MKSIKLIPIILILSIIRVSGQTYSLSGTVKDSENLPLPFANVAVYNADKSLQNGVITLNDGSFMIENLTPAIYTLSVSFMGYITHEESLDVRQSIHLPEITLKEDAVNLQAVQVMGYRRLIKSDKGKTIPNVGGTMLASIPSVTMIMSFVPGVTVQGEMVEVVGKGIPLIFIDGREVKNQNQVSALQPERIKSITVDRNPSAKYDARYRSVVHIETIPTKKQEFSAQLIHGSSMGNLYSYSETVNMNHSTGTWTNFLSYKYKNQREKEGVEVFQNVWNGNVFQKNSYNADMAQNRHLHNLTFGSNLRINEKHNIDLQYLLNKENGNFDIDGTETLSGKSNAFYIVKRKGENRGEKHTVNLNYRWMIDSLSQFDVFADYAHINNKDNEIVKNTQQSNNAIDNYGLNSRSTFNTYALRAE